jgi:xanthine dehydrogenase small subunit
VRVRDAVTLFVNGARHDIRGDDALLQLSDFLRLRLRLTGAKIVCAEGDCGSCSVLVGRLVGNSLRYRAVCSCIAAVFQFDGAHVVTVEGLRRENKLNAIQRAMVQCHGTQCGFCTPGFVVSLAQHFNDGCENSRACLTRSLVGNLCRCTGYDSILSAAESVKASEVESVDQLHPPGPIIMALRAIEGESLQVTAGDRSVFKPVTIAEAAKWRSQHPTGTIVAGGTDVGVGVNKKHHRPTQLMSMQSIADLNKLEIRAGAIHFGAAVSITDLASACKGHFPELHEYLQWFASPLIENSATLAGNIATGSPIGDSMPPLFVMNATVELTSQRGTRLVPINDFYLGYRKSILQPDELITGVVIPLLGASESVRFAKVSKRKDLDISAVSLAIWMKRKGGVVEQVRIAAGGVAATTVRFHRTESHLSGKPFDAATWSAAADIASGEVSPISDHRGSADYRRTLVGNLIRRFYREQNP